ncbi:DNA repair protein complementing XP-G cell [Entamoeba marina]
MGVTGLWKIVNGCNKTIQMKDLKGKIICIDISYYVMRYLSVKMANGIYDEIGSISVKAWVFQFWCKCVFYGIKPIFVFDGNINTFLKEETQKKRREAREKT